MGEHSKRAPKTSRRAISLDLGWASKLDASSITTWRSGTTRTTTTTSMRKPLHAKLAGPCGGFITRLKQSLTSVKFSKQQLGCHPFHLTSWLTLSTSQLTWRSSFRSSKTRLQTASDGVPHQDGGPLRRVAMPLLTARLMTSSILMALNLRRHIPIHIRRGILNAMMREDGRQFNMGDVLNDKADLMALAQKK